MSDAKVFHAHLWGTRKHKYAELRDSGRGNLNPKGRPDPSKTTFQADYART